MLIPATTFIQAMQEIGFNLIEVEPFFLWFERKDIRFFIWHRTDDSEIETSFALDDVARWSPIVRDELAQKLIELIDFDSIGDEVD